MIDPDNPDHVFVFGSNLAGRHGRGAAFDALSFHGAEPGVGEGHTGRSYAIPTKDKQIRSREVREIGHSVGLFKAFANGNPEKTFFVTRLGCGLAGFRDEHIAPLFSDAGKNVRLSALWQSILNPDHSPVLLVARVSINIDAGELIAAIEDRLNKLPSTTSLIVNGVSDPIRRFASANEISLTEARIPDSFSRCVSGGRAFRQSCYWAATHALLIGRSAEPHLSEIEKTAEGCGLDVVVAKCRKN